MAGKVLLIMTGLGGFGMRIDNHLQYILLCQKIFWFLVGGNINSWFQLAHLCVYFSAEVQGGERTCMYMGRPEAAYT